MKNLRVLEKWAAFTMALPAVLLFALQDAHAFWPFGDSGIDYNIAIEGVDAETLKWFESLKLTKKTDDHPPQNTDELEQEAVTLGGKLRQAMAAKGYYDALSEHTIDKTAKVPLLHYKITPYLRYKLSDIKVNWEGGVVRPLDVKQFPVHIGDLVDAEAINKHAAQLLTDIAKDACLLSLNIIPVVQINSKDASAVLIYQVKHGPKANFGALTVSGNKTINQNAVRRALAWKRGECYTEAAVTKTRSTLIGTQLFSTVKITPSSTINDKGESPVAIEVTERVPRTVSVGTNYATDRGFGVKLGWEHRNFNGDAEKFNVNTVIAEQEQSIAVNERIAGFLRDDQVLTLASAVKFEDTDAYTAKSITASAGVERRISPHLNAGAGLGYLLTQTEDNVKGNQEFGLIYSPLFAEYDTRDNAQDARKGVYLRSNITPYVDTFGLSTQFVKGQLTGQTYLSSEITGKPTLALRASVGGIGGSTASSLPADLRFYAGGGGSVRGYSYQSLAPYAKGDPFGGASLVELSSELRIRFSESFGGVAFIDAGNAYEDGIPDFKNTLYYGAGVGVRYYSPLGPLRFDVAFPLNGSNINNSGEDQKGFAIYVSLGQAF